MKWIILSATLLLSSCMIPFPMTGQGFAPQDLTVQPQYARVIVFRPTDPIDSWNYTLAIDNNVPQEFVPPIFAYGKGKSYVSYLVKPGRHLLTIRQELPLDNYEPKKKPLRQNITVDAGRIYFYLFDSGTLAQVSSTSAKAATTTTTTTTTTWHVLE